VKGARLVLRAQGTRPTRRSRWFQILAIAFMFIWLIGLNEVHLALPRPLSRWLATPAFAVAFVPFAVWYMSRIWPRLGHALGMTQDILSRATLDPTGIELSGEGLAPQRHRWDDIAALERADRDWRLVGLDGATVADVPHELALPQSSWSDAPTLAEAIVEMRPDRFALRGGLWRPGLTEMALRETADPVGRPKVAMRLDMVLTGVLLLVGAMVVVFVLPESR
jgi:hypothetical protein